MISSSQLKQNLCFIQSKIESAAQLSGRKTDEISIVAATKTFSPDAWKMALDQNLFIVGENKTQETENKLNQFKYRKQIELHLIGHLQRNKARKAINMFDVIQTVDTIKLLRRIEYLLQEKNKKQKIFLQVNTEKDPQKHGFTKMEALNAAEKTTGMSYVELSGIMTVPPQNISEEKLCTIYRETRELKEKIEQTIESKCKHLSMGMSNDFEIAIREGATHIRLGTALFGERQK